MSQRIIQIRRARAELNAFNLRAGYEGGKHQGGWGTENVIIPLGQGYLEIAAVFDPVAAQTCDWGKCVCRRNGRAASIHTLITARDGACAHPVELATVMGGPHMTADDA